MLTTTGSLREARVLARWLLHEKLAACVNVIPQVESHYWWKARVEKGREFLLLIKTSRLHLAALARLIRRHHSYELPELVALPLVWGESRYLAWLAGSLRKL